jgi:4a-hydroxytetrahydrobiopterin dehydratase
MSAAFSILLVLGLLSLVSGVQAKYLLLEGEHCEVLSNSTSLFDHLLPCGVYSTDPIELYCLDDAQTAAAMKGLPKWTLVKDAKLGNSIKRSFLFPDFRTAFLFMTKSAQVAETNQHHPNWSNLYNTVDVTLNTDDKLCLSSFDTELAKAMDKIALSLSLV